MSQRALVPLALVAVLGLAGCGQVAPAAADPAAVTVDVGAFRACLAANGVVLPEPGGGPTEAGSAAPAGGPPPVGAAPDTAVEGAAAPGSAGSAPDARGGPGTGTTPHGVDPATWAAAQEACTHLLPTPPVDGG